MMLRKMILLSLIVVILGGCGERYYSGDRVLVAKCSYDNGITRPNRYDVVVFKFPTGPMERNTPKNYIKRLLGLPGELLAIFFGRLYRCTEPPPYDDRNAVDARGKQINPNDLWMKEPFLHTNEEKARDLFKHGKFEILRKPPHVMMALRRIVYDNDYQAKDLKEKKFPDRWTPPAKSSWKNDDATGFINDGTSNQDVAWLRYQHVLRPEGPLVGGMNVKPMLILDTLDYNTLQTSPDREGDHEADLHRRIYQYAHWVGDLMLECDVEVVEPKGEFWFELSKGRDRFQARFDVSNGQCTLFRVTAKDTKEELATQATAVKAAGSYTLRFSNIDARLTVWVNRSMPFNDGFEYEPPDLLTSKDKERGLTWDDPAIAERRGPTQNDLQPASIGSKGASIKVKHLRLWRDTYYRTSTIDQDHKAKPSREDWGNPEQWSDFKKSDFLTMYVQPGHFLCLGDNSQASSDSRDWGLVPERLMLGRALLVYYPLDRIGPIR